MSAEDRRRMQALGRSLATVETDVAPSEAGAAAAVEAADVARVAQDRAPLRPDAERPEEEFYRRARALGFRRRRR